MYIIKGIVHPERAQLSFGLPEFSIHHPATNNEAKVKLNILLNRITLLISTDNDWDLDDLRNLAKKFVNDYLAIIGFIKGYAYDAEIIEILNIDKGIDYVYGIDIPCIGKRNEKKDIKIEMDKIMLHTDGEWRMYINRCLGDLVMAMKFTDDTGFYCYRAIESLKQYCKVRFELDKEKDQWEKFREITGCLESDIKMIKDFADLPRHGDIIIITSKDREKIFLKAWDIIDSFFNNIK